MNKKVRNTLIVIFTGVICFSGYNLYKIISQYVDGRETYNEIVEEIIDEDAFSVNWNKLLKRNSDVVAWIRQETSNINYPIVQSSDNSEYLYKDLDHKYSIYGTPFVHSEIKNPFNTTLTIVYGHNMKDGYMFSSLNKYLDDDKYYKKHKTMEIFTPEKDYTMHIIAAGRPKGDDPIVYNYLAEDAEDYVNSISEYLLTKRTIYSDDKIVLLSTCTPQGSAYDSRRTCVWGVLEETK